MSELLVELLDTDGEKAYAHYAAFSIGSEVEGYALKVLGGYSGDAGDSLIYHAGSRFSTKDLDQDSWLEGNCAQAHSKNREKFPSFYRLVYLLFHFSTFPSCIAYQMQNLNKYESFPSTALWKCFIIEDYLFFLILVSKLYAIPSL